MKKSFKIIVAILLIALAIIPTAACEKNHLSGVITVDLYAANGTLSETKEIKFDVYRNYAPITVGNFVKLVNDGYYNNTALGGYVLSSTGSSVYSFGVGNYYYDANGNLAIKEASSYGNIVGEFEKGGWMGNPLSDTKGKLVMLRGDTYNSASAAFAITLVSGQFPTSTNCIFATITDSDSMENLSYLGDISKYNADAYDYEYYALRDGVLYYIEDGELFTSKTDMTSHGDINDDTDEVVFISPNKVIIREITVK